MREALKNVEDGEYSNLPWKKITAKTGPNVYVKNMKG